MQYDDAVPALLPAGHAVQLVADPRLYVLGPHTGRFHAARKARVGGEQGCVRAVAIVTMHVRLQELLPDCGW